MILSGSTLANRSLLRKSTCELLWLMAYLAEPVVVVSPAAAPRDVIIDAASGRVQLGAPSPIVHGDEGKIDRIEAERRELEAERMKESERVVTGLENEDLNALLRVFDKVSGAADLRLDHTETLMF